MNKKALPFEPMGYMLGDEYLPSSVTLEMSLKIGERTSFNEQWHTCEYLAALYAFDQVYISFQDDEKPIDIPAFLQVTLNGMLRHSTKLFKELMDEGGEFDVKVAKEILKDSFFYWRSECTQVIPDYGIDYNNQDPQYFLAKLTIIKGDYERNLISVWFFSDLLMNVLKKSKANFKELSLSFYFECLNIVNDYYIRTITANNKGILEHVEGYIKINTIEHKKWVAQESQYSQLSLQEAANNLIALNKYYF